jgi:hypothetical protein
MGLFPKRDVRWSWVRRFVRFKRGADTYPRFLGGKYVMSAPFLCLTGQLDAGNDLSSCRIA